MSHFLRKTNVSYPLIPTSPYAYQEVININLLENFAYLLIGSIEFIELIEIWHIWYIIFNDFDFHIKNDFYDIFTICSTELTSRLKLLRNSCLVFQVFRSQCFIEHLRQANQFGHRVWILIMIIKCKVIFLKYTACEYYYL